MQINKINSTLLNEPNFKNISAQSVQTPFSASSASVLSFCAPDFSEYAKGVIKAKNLEYDLYYDFNDLKTTTLPNNLEVVFDVSPVSEKTHIEFQLKPNKKLGLNPSVQYILSLMLLQDPHAENDKYYKNKLREENYFSYGASLTTECLCGELVYSDPDAKTGLDKMLHYLLNPDLTQEKLDMAKKEAAKYLKDDSAANSKANADLFNEEETTVDTCNKTTLDEVKNLHKTLLENSGGKIVISLSNEQYLKNKDEILNLLSAKVPDLKPYKPVEDYRTIGSVEKDTRYESKGKGKVSVEKYFTPTDNGTLKDEIILHFLNEAIDKAAEDVPHSSNITDIESDFSPNTKNKFIYFYSKSAEGLSKEKQPSTKEVEDYINSVIQAVMNNKTDDKTFNSIKNKVRKERIEEYKSPYSRQELLFNSYTKGTNSMKDFIKTLDSITPDDIQQAAKKYFSAPSITALES